MNFRELDLSRNKLQGDVSMFFGSNKIVQSIDLSRNFLEFDLSNVVFPTSLTWLDLNHNKIYGKLLVELTALDIRNLNVGYNRLWGQISVGGRLQSIGMYSHFHNKALICIPILITGVCVVLRFPAASEVK